MSSGGAAAAAADFAAAAAAKESLAHQATAAIDADEFAQLLSNEQVIRTT